MSKKVLIVVQNFSVPKDTRVWLESLALSKQGFKVSVVCPRGKNEPGYEKISDIEIYRCRIPTPFSGVSGYAIEYAWSFIAMTATILRLHLKKRFDAIQVCNPPDFFFHIGWLSRLTGAKFIFDQHDLSPELVLTKFKHSRFLYRIAIWMEKMTCGISDAVISTNASYARIALDRNKVPKEKSWIVRNGPVLQEFDQVNPDTSLKKGYKYMVVYAGEIAEQDGVDILIKAIKEVIDKGHNDTLFAVLGDGSALSQVKKLAIDLEVGKWVDFKGWVNYGELIQYMKTADICIAPEPSNPLNDKSTFVKVTEYLAAGSPIVAFNLPETVVSAADAAIYAKPNDYRELAINVISLLGDQEKRLQLKKAAIKRRPLIAWVSSEEVYIKLFRELLDEAKIPGTKDEPLKGSKSTVSN